MKARQVKQDMARAMSERSRWAYCMQGAAVEEIDSGCLDALTHAFGAQHPQWLIASKPWKRITGGHFKELRTLLRMTRKQCAAFLRLDAKTIERWETGKHAPAFAAYETLRLTLDTMNARASHRIWDGWFISRDGEWVSPNVGKLAIKPWELDRWPQLLADISKLQFEKARLVDELAAATAENTRLRKLFLAQGVTKELQRMHDRIGDLLAGINTAEIVEFERPNKGASLMEAVA
jgi:transcriptional regulator with XRE-family HTH domain